MEIQNVESVLRICIFLASIITAVFTIYLIYNIYDISGEFKVFYNKEVYCGSNVMEQETFRYQLYTTTLPSEIDKERFINTIKEFQTTVAVVSTIGLLIILCGFIFAIYLTKLTPIIQYDWFFQLVFLTITYILMLVFVYTYLPSIDNKDKKNNVFTDTGYEKSLKEIKKQIKTNLEKKNGDGDMFIKYGLNAFPEEFVNLLVERWQSLQRLKESSMDIPEPILTKSETIEELNKYFFEINKEGYVTKVNEDHFIELLRPSETVFLTGNTQGLTDIDIINLAIRDWACVDNSTGKSNALTCPNSDKPSDLTDKYISSLPDLGEFKKYKDVDNAMSRLKVAGWALFSILLYSLFHTYYKSMAFPIYTSISLLIFITVVIMYYIMIIRNKA